MYRALYRKWRPKTFSDVVGQAGITWQDCEGQPVLEVGYLLKKRFWHQGYASEAAQACRDYAFRVLGAEKVSSIIKTDNAASIRVAQRNGMRREKEFAARYYNGPVPHYLYTVWKDGIMDTTYCIEQLKALCAIDSPSGFTDRAADYLSTLGVERVDLLILTHCHSDHANGAAELLERMAVDVLALPGAEEEVPLREELMALAEEKGCTVAQLSLAWLFHQGMNAYAVFSTGSPARIAANCGALEVVLTPAECRWLNLEAHDRAV